MSPRVQIPPSMCPLALIRYPVYQEGCEDRRQNRWDKPQHAHLGGHLETGPEMEDLFEGSATVVNKRRR